MFNRNLLIIGLVIAFFTLTTSTFAQGRKMGLFVGIDAYQDGIKPLQSCVNDAVNMQNKLVGKYGFSQSNTSLVTNGDATRQNILAKLAEYESKAMRGDLFVFYYSGHGSIFPDANSLEADETVPFGMPDYFPTGYYDSALVPVDGRQTTSGKPWKNLILDDELNVIFSRFAAKGVQVVFISDSCHSGSLGKDLNFNKKQTKFIAPKILGFNTDDWRQVVNRGGTKSGETYNKLFLVIGSSQDNQFSAAGSSTEMSLFTKVLLRKMDDYASANKVFTYQSIVDEVNPLVDRLSDKEQTPRLDDRFYDASLLSRPVFSLLNVGNNQSNKLRIVVKVTDENNNPITDAAFGVFPIGLKLGPGQISKTDPLILGRTNNKGFYDSASLTLDQGKYQIKVVKQGFQAFIKDMDVEPSNNDVAVFVFKLVKE